MKKGHDRSGCWATNHADGHKLTCEKPAPVPEKYRKAISSIQVHAQSDMAVAMKPKTLMTAMTPASGKKLFGRPTM